MLKFIFILTLGATDGSNMVYVMEANMTGPECVEAVENYVATTPGLEFGFPACEVDMATQFHVTHEGRAVTLSACPTEDSDNCFWDGMQHGNGRGQSFYTLDGVTYLMD
jgi:hypothetical protein